MDWTKDPPTVEGWYFLRDINNHENWTIKLVYKHRESGPLMAALRIEDQVQKFKVEWLGPVTPDMIVH